MPSESTKLNPQIASIEIGTRSLRKIQIFPLAAGAQLKMIRKIGQSSELLSQIVEDAQAVGNIIGLITEYLPEIIGQIIPTNEKVEIVLNEMSMKQLEELALLVYEMNFESIAKNLQSLFAKAMVGVEMTERVKRD